MTEEASSSSVSPSGFRWRLVFACLGSIGMAIIYGLKVNLSVAIVAMINYTNQHQVQQQQQLLLLTGLNISSMTVDDHHAASSSDDAVMCYNSTMSSGDAAKAQSEDGPFTWSEPEQSVVLGSYFWGYLITQVPGGRAADFFGGKWVFFLAVILNIVPTLLSPVCAYWGYEYLIVMRVVEGLGGGLTWPGMNAMVSKWAPKQERSGIASICLGGASLGTVLAITSAGFIASSFGWEAVFYWHGGLSVIWCVLWVIFVTNTPAEHKFISKAERDYILNSYGGGGGSDSSSSSTAEKKKPPPPPPVPWKIIFTSRPVWAIIITHTLNNCGWYMFLVELPLFMKNGMGFNIRENGVLSCLPYLCNWLCAMAYSNRLDWARSNGHISTINARKLSVFFASVMPAACLVGVCLSQCDRVAVVVLMVVAMFFYGAMFSGVVSNHVDIASNFAGVLMGISNMSATLPGFLVPALVGVLTHGKPGLGPWHVIFYLTAAILVLEFIVFALMGTSTEQEWNKLEQKRDEEEQGNEEEEERLNKPGAK